MDYFEQSARDFIKALTVYYEDTRDPEISTSNCRMLLTKMAQCPAALPYILPLLRAVEAEAGGFEGMLGATIARVKEIWELEHTKTVILRPGLSRKIVGDTSPKRRYHYVISPS